MFISGASLSNTQKIAKQVTDYKVQGEDDEDIVEDSNNKNKPISEILITENDHIKELETFREGYNDDVQGERSSTSMHDHTYESLCMKKP